MNGIRRLAGAVLVLVSLAPARGARAQTIERTDTPRKGDVRVSFEPRIDTWDQLFTSNGERTLGSPFTTDSVGPAQIPMLGRLEQDVRTASGIGNYVPTLGAGTLTVYQEKRVTPLGIEVGLSNRFSFSVNVPIVRVSTRSNIALAQGSANLGANPLATSAGSVQQYATFFGQFNAALTTLQNNINAGMYGCASNPGCAANATLAQGRAVRDALERTIYGVGAVQNPFVPLSRSPAGMAIDTSIAHLQQQLSAAYNVPGFSATLLLPDDTLAPPAAFDAFVGEVVGQNSAIFGFGYNPLGYNWHYGLGNIELEAKYRFVEGPHYALAVAGIGRLPTATRDTTLDFLGIPVADFEPGFEGRVLQELIVAKHLWLNLALRGGVQLPGTASRRVAPFDALFVPYQATTTLNWDPGDYVGVDFAPLYRFTPHFGVGVTTAFWSRGADHYSYRTAQDSVALAAAQGFATPAAILDAGTSQQWVRVGFAMTYAGPVVEGGFTVEETVSGSGEVVPAAIVYRLRLRISHKLF
ncbi:MAG TPA: hypothetical protein VLT79_07185 [Gemmatimonadales bacterium]|nr:hypothetical protein [Gemmatimonadales bacterium]